MPHNSAIVLGVDQSDVYGPLLSNKRVALMVNQSSIDSEGTHTIDKLLALQNKYHFKVIKLFSVEHGIRGNEDAGAGDNDHIDSQTGLPIVSLYGRDETGRVRAQPSKAQLDDVDVVIYDLQDVGVRFFTYTISMHHMLESLRRYNKSFMVFDRPNPTGNSIYGPLLEEENISGIGIHPIPMVHGLTSAEFANMIVGEGWLTNEETINWKKFGLTELRFPAEKLHLITMKNYQHNTYYALPKNPSPNLRTELAIKLYPSLALFEATSVNMGRGSEHPFEQLAFPSTSFYKNISYIVDPIQTQYGWPQGGKTVYGEKFWGENLDPKTITPSIKPLVKWWYGFKNKGYKLAIDMKEEANYLTYQNDYFVIRPLWLAKLVGRRDFVTQLQYATNQGLSEQQAILLIENSWQQAGEKYRQMREKYKLYQ